MTKLKYIDQRCAIFIKKYSYDKRFTQRISLQGDVVKADFIIRRFRKKER